MNAPLAARLKPRINLDDRTALETVIPLATPFVVFVDPSSACNFLCKFCPTGHRDLIDETGRFQGVMKLDLFRKIVDDLAQFEEPIRVLRLYKDGEPFLNKQLPEMIRLAKASGRVRSVDTTTNGSLFTPERLAAVLDAGLDRINISVDGMNAQQYREFTGYDFDFDRFVGHVRWLYANRGTCEVVIKLPGDLVDEDQKRRFFDTFGPYADRILVENFAPCWPEFDVEAHTGVKIGKGLYQHEPVPTDTCPYVFYSISVNADGLVSACFLDWGRKLPVGDVRREPLREIWHSPAMNALRRQQLEGGRHAHPVCGSCGQLSYCLPDNIDAHRSALLPRFLAYARLPDGAPVPGMAAARVIPLKPA